MSTEQLLRTPKTAWPTILVALSAIVVQAFALFGAAHGLVPWWLAATLSGLAAFAAFTPMHDATHRSVSRNRTVNDWIGRLSAIVLMSPFAAFRYVHLEHHKHTNDPELDPDHYSGRGAAWTLPLRWLTQDLHYYVLIARQWSSRPRAERIEVVASLAVILGLVGILVGLGYGTAVVLIWIVPSRLAIAALSFSFDYLPHVPHQVPSSVDRFAATRIMVAPGMTALFLFQNYHLIHHLYPAVPFYRYRRVYLAQQETLLAKGAQVWQWPAPKHAVRPLEN